MKSFRINENDSGQRVDRFIEKTFDHLPKSLMYKEIRKKNIKVNKKRCTPDQHLNTGDLLELYLKDDVLKCKQKHYDFMKASTDLDIIYEDKNLLLIDKKVGVLCHPDSRDYIDNLISRIKRYLYEKGEWEPDNCLFTPSLANRIDRNTGGIVIAAKNMQTLQILNSMLKSRQIKKYYLAVVRGKMEKKQDTLTAYLKKDEQRNIVTVTDKPSEGAKKIVTKYTVLDCYDKASLLEIDLLTGRTHQIRAHMAHIGHPLFGDGKYGTETGRNRQALYSFKLKFNFRDENSLSYLNNKEFETHNIELIKNFKEKKYR